MIRRALVLLTAVLACVLTVWVTIRMFTNVIGFDYSIPLPGCYELVSIYSGAVVLCGPDHVCISEPTVDGYAVYGDVILVHASANQDFHTHVGYFVVDTKTGKKLTDLNERDYLAALRGYGIKRAPLLHRPSRWRAIVESLKL